MRALVVLILACSVCAQAQVPPPRPTTPPRDAVGPVPSGTARIRGRVVDAETTTPIRRAQVQLSGDQNVVRIVTTDGEGRFEISELPAGRFTLTASKGGFVTTQYGQRGPFEPARPIVVEAGRVHGQVDLAMSRAAAIVGRVIDRFGEPAVGAEIVVERYQYGTDGQRRLVRAPTGAAVADDRGAFRSFGLPPGEYVISANVQQRPQLPGQGAPATPVVGNLQTYFPGAPNAAEAQPIVLEAGEEAVAEFTLLSGRLANIAGTVIDATGRPAAGAEMMLTTVAANGAASGRGTSSTSNDGTFTITRVPPGDHFIQVRVQPRPGGVSEPEMANLAVSILGDSIEGLQVVTTPALTVVGRVEWDGDAPRTGGSVALRISTQTADGRPALMGIGATPQPDATGIVGRDGRFSIGALLGKVRFVANGLPPQWMLKTITAGGTDITDSGVDVATLGTDEIRVVLSDKVTEITGAARDARGEPLKEYVAVILPETPVEGSVAARYTRAVRADEAGSFSVRGLPPGRYVAAAMPALQPGSEWDPAFQASVRTSGRRFALDDGQSLTLSLTLSP